MVTFKEEHINIFYKLWRNRCFGKGHMLIDTLVNGFPNDQHEFIKDAIDELIKHNYLIKKPSKHGYYVYINLTHKRTIEKAIKSMYTFYFLH